MANEPGPFWGLGFFLLLRRSGERSLFARGRPAALVATSYEIIMDLHDESESLRTSPYRQGPEPRVFRRKLSPGAFFAFSWVSLGSLAMMLIAHHYPSYPGRAESFYMCAGVTTLGVLHAIYMIVQLRQYSKQQRPYGYFLAWAALPLGTFVAWVGSALVYESAYVASYMGRRHRKGNRLFAPKTAPGAAWGSAGALSLPLPDSVRSSLGAEWRDNARKEHASVAAFAQLALDLMAVGAPPDLIAKAHQDALDEVRHAGTCFEVARDIDGIVESPQPFPEARVQKRLLTFSRPLALSQIALDALVDGVLNEGIAARLLAALAGRCEIPSLAFKLRSMARDESRHAAHSWEIIAWCMQEGGTIVMSALRGAVNSMPRSVCSALPAAARAGAWEAWGVQGTAMEAEAFDKTRMTANVKLTAMLESASRRAA